MSKTKDQLIERDELLEKYVDRTIGEMEMVEVLSMLRGFMLREGQDIELDNLKKEVEEFYPDLLV